MLKATAVVAGLLMVATQKTLFDATGVHISTNPLVELTVCVLPLVLILASDR
ncbi:hypothetical protein Pla123a_41590 [Posidoniimonas polymericola]|uniref:Uncharacterized protein n=1 Tax=Posidoniimonas polymericola TaxID=2528002 RepID=A0A5C5XZ92_9BACT|nr:hypothetical protein [Posidoniimonas polymericola]TWT67603.1 hypothetical protein Pla123a_41590 [Posidoniimonas polymericola]